MSICQKTLSITVAGGGGGTPPCGFWQPCSISKGILALQWTAGDLITWAALDEGEYDLTYLDDMLQLPDVLCLAPDPAEPSYGIFNFPSPLGNSPLSYLFSGVHQGYLPSQDPYTEVYCPSNPTSLLSFHLDTDAIADYLTKPLPSAFFTAPVNTFGVWNYNVMPGLYIAGQMQFELTKSQELINPQPKTLTPVNVPVSLAMSRFTLTYGGNTTVPLAFTANAITVQLALNALASITADGGVVCAGAIGAGMTITWNVNGNRAAITSSITTVSPAYYVSVVTTQNGTGMLPEIQTLTVAPWSTYLISFPGLLDWAGGLGNRDLWDVSTYHHWYEVLVASYSLNPPPQISQDVGLVDVWCRNCCGPAAPSSACLAVAGGAGNVEAGVHSWVIVFVQAGFAAPLNLPESGPSPVRTLALAVNSQVNLSNIPIGPAGTTDRYVFRTTLSSTVPRYVGNLGDNLTTVFTDNVSDATVNLGYPVHPSSHFWWLELVGVADPFGFGPPYAFVDVIWRGVKVIGQDPVGRYYPYPPRMFFDPTTYHANLADGIAYYDVNGVF